MATRYPVHETEAKWRHLWEANESHRVDLDRAPRPFYNLMEFPYPSGEGLHVGHVYTYCGADAFGRLRRMQGYDVFQPMGFDAFGIHSENYALKIGRHPADIVPENIRRFREDQLKRLGCQFDWSRTVDTTSPDYYCWTQWIFLQLYKAGLAYQAEAPVNWCPQDQTVLANEQVIDGHCERCGSTTERRVMRQWFFRITAYADRLLDYNGVDFPLSSVKRQTAWIGRSAGAEIKFAVEERPHTITIFTTRADTIFGAAALILAPEHPLVDAITTDDQRTVVRHYVAAARRKLERDRLMSEQQTGAWTGAYAVNPVNQERLPIWIADYVLGHYGTGAIMAVPAHDERDWRFAQHSCLPVRPVVVPADGSAPSDNQPFVDDGILHDSAQFTGLASAAGRAAITAWLAEQGVAQPRVTYRLHDWLISRQRYWGPPIPMVYCPACGTVPVPEDLLPVVLPRTENFRPTGVAPLAAVPEFVNTACPSCAGPARRETDVSDNFLDSAWYYLRYTSTDEAERPWNPQRAERWLPVDQYAGGPEHTTMHHLYARFIVKALHDLGYLPFDEPFKRLRLHGTITKDGAKMSKSRGNVISPDGYIETYGADVFRMYMLFLGPWEDGGDFTDAGLGGVARFVGRVWDMVTSPRLAQGDKASSTMAEQRRHRLVARVTAGIETLRFHVAIAALMEESGWLREHAAFLGREQWQRCVETLAALLAPFAPHFAAELWVQLGRTGSVHEQPWPEYVSVTSQAATVELVVQVDGKVRDKIVVASDADGDMLRQAALASERVQRVLGGAQPARIVVVPGKVVNVVR